MIPVHLDCLPDEVRAECAKCGKCAAAGVEPGRSRRAARVREAKAAALAGLTAACELELPWGVAPRHHERLVPRGLSAYCAGERGELLPLALTKPGKAGRLDVYVEKGALEIPHVGCHPKALVLVVPDADTDGLKLAAAEFARALVELGYPRAPLAPAGRAKKEAGAKR